VTHTTFDCKSRADSAPRDKRVSWLRDYDTTMVEIFSYMDVGCEVAREGLLSSRLGPVSNRCVVSSGVDIDQVELARTSQ